MKIRQVMLNDAKILSEYFLENKMHFREWEPKRKEDFNSILQWEKGLIEYDIEQEEGKAAYFIALDIRGKVLGHCSLTNISYGFFQAGYMGYGVSKWNEGKGIMFQLCGHVIAYAFQNLKLNRVMANYIPRNTRTENLLNRLGFVKEGLAKKYLKINGVWQDHILTSLINSLNR